MIPEERLEAYRHKVRAAYALVPCRDADEREEDRQFFAAWRTRAAREAGQVFIVAGQGQNDLPPGSCYDDVSRLPCQEAAHSASRFIAQGSGSNRGELEQ